MFVKVLPCLTLLGLPFAFAYPTGFGAIAAVSNAIALSWYTPDSTQGLLAPQDPTSFYNCKGPLIPDFPAFTEWISFDEMWRINLPVIQAANQENSYSGPSPIIKEKIVAVSQETKVDARLILAVVMEESTGQLDVKCTTWSTTNCGIMQAPSGSVSFNPADPANSIEQMIRDGVQGTASGPGLLEYLNGAISWIQYAQVGNPYLAAHLYNAGSASQGDNLGVAEGGNKKSKAYATDISSRLTGWDGGYAGCLASVQCPGQLRDAGDCSQ